MHDNENSDEVDIFDLTVTPPPTEPIETETNSYSAETLRQAMAHTLDAEGDEDDFDVGPPPPSQEAPANEAFDADDGFVGQKSGLLSKLLSSKLIRKITKKRGQGEDESLLGDDEDAGDASAQPSAGEPVAVDSGIFEISQPPTGGSRGSLELAATESGVFEMTATPQESVPEEPFAHDEPVVTDSGIFETTAPPKEPMPNESFATNEPVAVESGVFEISQPVAIESTAEEPPAHDEPTVTDSGVFEMTAPPEESTPEEPSGHDEPAATDSGVFEMMAPPEESTPEEPSGHDEPAATDSGVFEMMAPPEESTPEEPSGHDEPAATDSGVFEMMAPPPIDSGVFEISQPKAEESYGHDEPVAIDSGVFEMTAPPPIDSGVFEISQPVAEEPAAANGEWEIGWEPEGDVDAEAHAEGSAEEEFDVSAAPAPLPPPPVFTRIAHVCIYVENLERSVEYYSKIGFEKRFAFNKNGKLYGVYLEFGGGNFIELFEDASRSAEATGKLAHFCLETPDIDAATESLAARGIEFTPKKLGCDSTYQIWLTDPDGNSFEIHQYTPESSQIVGRDVEADW